MNHKHYQKICHANKNVNLMVENVIQIKIEIMIIFGAIGKTLKNTIYVKKTKFGIMLYVVEKMVNI